MANAKQCDRCFSFYEPYKTPVKNGKWANGFKFSDGLHNLYEIDLCPVCMASLIEWLTINKKEGPKDE